jgi:prepilin-type N-terminal cleavage/methylation domain-containing protein
LVLYLLIIRNLGNSMNKVFTRGFTLIELLVVIAIIGILAAIVLVSLGTVRQKGSDAVIQGNLDSVRTQAEVYSNNNGNSYGTQAFATVGPNTQCGAAGMWNDTTIARATKGATAQAGTATIDSTANQSAACYSSANAWFVAVVLKSDATLAWCVDSNGKSGTTTVASVTSSLTTCP